MPRRERIVRLIGRGLAIAAALWLVLSPAAARAGWPDAMSESDRRQLTDFIGRNAFVRADSGEPTRSLAVLDWHSDAGDGVARLSYGKFIRPDGFECTNSQSEQCLPACRRVAVAYRAPSGATIDLRLRACADRFEAERWDVSDPVVVEHPPVVAVQTAPAPASKLAEPAAEVPPASATPAATPAATPVDPLPRPASSPPAAAAAAPRRVDPVATAPTVVEPTAAAPAATAALSSRSLWVAAIIAGVLIIAWIAATIVSRARRAEADDDTADLADAASDVTADEDVVERPRVADRDPVADAVTVVIPAAMPAAVADEGSPPLAARLIGYLELLGLGVAESAAVLEGVARDDTRRAQRGTAATLARLIEAIDFHGGMACWGRPDAPRILQDLSHDLCGPQALVLWPDPGAPIIAGRVLAVAGSGPFVDQCVCPGVAVPGDPPFVIAAKVVATAHR